MVPACDVSGFGLKGEPGCAHRNVGPRAVGVSQHNLISRPAGMQESPFHQRFEVDALWGQVRIDSVVSGDPFPKFGNKPSTEENTSWRHPRPPSLALKINKRRCCLSCGGRSRGEFGLEGPKYPLQIR